MDENERNRQVIIAKANLRLIRREFEDGISTIEHLRRAEKHYDDLLSHVVISEHETMPLKRQKAPFEGAKAALEVLTSYTPEVAMLIESLLKKRDNVHIEKATLCNMLHTIPEHEDCAELVREIIEKRNDWKELNAKVRFVQEHGCEPEQETTPMQIKQIDEAVLTREFEVKELWQLKEEIENCASNLSKARKNLNKVNDLTRTAHYQRKCTELEWKLSMMKTIYNSRK